MVAKNETPAQSETPDAHTRYWPGYDTLLDEISRVNAQLAEREGKNYREGSWRYNTRNKVLVPLETAARFRRDGAHLLILNRYPHGSETEEHRYLCGLIVDMPQLPDTLTRERLEARNTTFRATPGRIDWRIRQLKLVAGTK